MALDPGLVSDSGVDDYIAFLCSTGYQSYQIPVFTRDGSSVNCSAEAFARPGDLNYPAFSVVFSSYTDVVTYHRTVTNEGSSGTAVSEANVSNLASVSIKVIPSKLEFSSVSQSLSYKIIFSGAADDVTHPIAVTWPRSSYASS